MNNGISVIWGGDYSSTKTYYKNQAVFYLGSSYRANKTTTEEPSIDALDWDLLAQGADASDIDLDNYYTIEEVDTLLENKANQSNTYTKIETDNLLNLKPSSLSQLSDVQITSPVQGQLLYFDDVSSGKWVNQTVSLGGGGTGETNTASNVGLGGVGLFKQKTGVNLEFKNINAASNKISITNDPSNSEVDIDVNEANLTLGNLSGTLAIAKGGTGSTSASAALTALGGATTASVALKADTTALTSHTSNTSNPHSVTAAQVGNSTAQWNANKLQGVDVISTTPTNGQILTYNSTSTKWEPTTFAGASGGKVVQVVYASSNTITTVAAGAYTSIGLTASITPTVTSNILYFFVEIQGIEKTSGTADTNYIIGTQLYNTTSASATYTANCFAGRFTTGYIPPISFQAQGSITATTMNFAVRANVTGGSIRFQSNNTVSNIIIMEVSL
ncbi:Chitin-binding type-3 domain-containing protein [Nostoc sp. DSM 114160]|jgi:hypothetical protein